MKNVKVNGRTIGFPDDMPEEEIEAMLNKPEDTGPDIASVVSEQLSAILETTKKGNQSLLREVQKALAPNQELSQRFMEEMGKKREITGFTMQMGDKTYRVELERG